jgi:hypothetical protein
MQILSIHAYNYELCGDKLPTIINRYRDWLPPACVSGLFEEIAAGLRRQTCIPRERANQGLAVWTKTFRVRQKYRIAQLLPTINNNSISTCKTHTQKKRNPPIYYMLVSYLQDYCAYVKIRSGLLLIHPRPDCMHARWLWELGTCALPSRSSPVNTCDTMLVVIASTRSNDAWALLRDWNCETQKTGSTVIFMVGLATGLDCTATHFGSQQLVGKSQQLILQAPRTSVSTRPSCSAHVLQKPCEIIASRRYQRTLRIY